MEWQEKLHVSFDNGSFSYKTYPGIVIKMHNGSFITYIDATYSSITPIFNRSGFTTECILIY